jgi:hypothetical protein
MQIKATAAATMAIGECLKLWPTSPSSHREITLIFKPLIAFKSVRTELVEVFVAASTSSVQMIVALLHAHPFEVHEVVSQLHQIDLFAHAPSQRLLMQRNMADIV